MFFALSACAFDTSVPASSEGNDPTPAPDASEIAIDAVPGLACEQLGTQNQPITFLGQINTLAAGRYYFLVDSDLFEGEVDIDEGGDAWLMTLNYLHRRNSNPNLTIYGNRLPLLSSETLGTDESGSMFWGHISNGLFANLAVDEIRFYGRSSNHSRTLHLRSTHAETLDYFASGEGSAQGLGNDFEPYSDHSSSLPANQNSEFSNQGDFAQSNFPFWRFGDAHWGIRGGGYRWEVDDYNPGLQPDTLHRGWVRSHAVCGDGNLEGQEDCDDGNLVAGDGCNCCVGEGT